MIRKLILALGCVAILSAAFAASEASAADHSFGRTWGGNYGNKNMERFYHYPYVYYPQNFWGNDYYRSSESMYHRYPPEMRIPVYNKKWQNYYPQSRRYHSGHHFILDVF